MKKIKRFLSNETAVFMVLVFIPVTCFSIGTLVIMLIDLIK